MTDVVLDLREHYKEQDLLAAFGIARSTLNYRRQKASRADHERERLKAKAVEIHESSREAAGSRRYQANSKLRVKKLVVTKLEA